MTFACWLSVDSLEDSGCNSYRALPDLFPCQLPPWHVRSNSVSIDIEAHDLHTDRAGSATFHFMLVTEKVDSSFATPVI